MAEPFRIRPGTPGLVFVRDGRVRAVLSPPQLRLLLTAEDLGESVPVRQATRIIWPDHTGALTASQRASAARSITRLLDRGLIEQPAVGAPLALTDAGRRLLDRQRERIAEVLATA